jgi:hypothetical protein
VIAHVCTTCGTQFAPSDGPPASCPICLDERQYVPAGGQRWIAPAELRASHSARIEPLEPGLTQVGVEPRFAIGQRALHLPGLLWDCVPLLGEAMAAELEARGGIEAIAISHPHYHSTMVEWAERFSARILLHEADRQWIQRPSPLIELWSGEELALTSGCTLIRLGGHFPGATVCVWPGGAGGRGSLLAGDVIQVVADPGWVSFMWSYPNLIPLPAEEVERIAARVEGLDFDRLHGAWWDSTIASGAKDAVRRSARRYVDALRRTR